MDVDAHYADHFPELVEYIDEDDPARRQFEDSLPIEHSDSTTDLWPKLSGSTNPAGLKREGEVTPMGAETREDIVDVMDRLDIDKSIQLSSHMLTYGMIDTDDRRQTVYANAYTDYVLDNVVDPDRGIYMMVPAPYNDPNEAAELIDRVGDDRAVVGVCLISQGGPEPPLGNRRYDPIYDAAERAGLPVVFHGATTGLDQFYVAGFTSLLETHTLGFVWDNMAQIVSVVAQGKPDKFPDLEFVFQEAGLSYVAHLMMRMDTEYLRRHRDAAHLEKRPSEYMKDFYYGTQPIEQPVDPQHLEWIIEIMGGADRLMYASDWPHPDFDAPNAITQLSSLSSEEHAKILGRNAEEVFDV